MGIFDKLKQKKDNTQPTREEYENHITKVKKIIDNMDTGLGTTANETIKKDINQALEDIAIKEYGTEEEKRELSERKKQEKIIQEQRLPIKEKLQKAKRMNDKNSIKIYEEIIQEATDFPDMIISAYHGMADTYIHIRKFDKGIETYNECIEFKKQSGEDYSYETHRIEFITNLTHEGNLIQLQKEGESLCYNSKFDEAIPILNDAVNLGSNRYQTFKSLSECYIAKKDLDSAIAILNVGIERVTSKTFLHNDRHDGLEDIQDNVKCKIETGNFKWDCLPYDSQENASKIKEAKSILKEDEEKGIEMLEDIIEKGTFNNTAYYTLYKIYNKNKLYDECIRICDNAIEVLGYFSVDKLEKWEGYKNRIVGKILK